MQEDRAWIGTEAFSDQTSEQTTQFDDKEQRQTVTEKHCNICTAASINLRCLGMNNSTWTRRVVNEVAPHAALVRPIPITDNNELKEGPQLQAFG